VACSINVTKLEGDVVPPATDASVVRIYGTATDCASVRVVLNCAQQQVEQVATVSAAGTWAAQFTNLAGAGCRCYNLVRESVQVIVTCLADPECRYSQDWRLLCSDLCATVKEINFDAPACVDADPTTVTIPFSAVTSSPNAAGAFSWSFGDGSPGATGKFVSHAYKFPGQYTVTVTFTPSTPGCAPSSFSYPLNVPLCGATTPPPPPPPPPPPTPPPTPPPPGTTPSPTTTPAPTPTTTPAPALPPFPAGEGEGNGCSILRFLVVAAAIVAIIAALLMTCLPPAAYQALLAIAAVAGGLGLLGGIFWAIFCPKPCGIAILLLGQVTLGVGMGVLYFSLCCPLFLPIGSGLVAAGIGLFYWWARRCRKGVCDVAVQLLAALTGGIMPLLTYIDLVPVLSACKNPVAAIVLGSVAIAVNAAVVACASSKS
jgi:hypothetical protein